jgi:hypothetical protein
MLPTAMSLFASLCSASTLLGIPVEIYYCELIVCLSERMENASVFFLDGTTYLYFGNYVVLLLSLQIIVHILCTKI